VRGRMCARVAAKMPGALVIAAAIALASSQVAVAQQTSPPQQPPLDSATVRELVAEAQRTADSAPATERDALLVIVGSLQAELGDFAASGRTLARLVESQRAPSTPRGDTLAAWTLPGYARNLACHLHDHHRPADALAALRLLDAGEGKEWQLAREAAYLARPARWLGDTTLTPADELARRRQALELARELRHPQARLDALLAVMESTPDSGASGALRREAYEEARRVRLDDPDLRSARNAILAAEAVRLGRADDAFELYAGLTDRRDVLHVIVAASESADSALLRRLAPRAIAAVREVRDAQARRQFSDAVRTLLRRAGAVSLLAKLSPAPEQEPDASEPPLETDEPGHADTSSAADPIEAAKAAVSRGDFSQVMREVERLPDRDPYARRALFWYELSRHVRSFSADTSKVYLRRGREALERSRADSAAWDFSAWRLAQEQLMLAEHVEGVRTLNLIRSTLWGELAVDDWNGPTALLRRYADQVRAPHVRDAVLLRIVTRQLSGANATMADAAYARALADSIATPAHRAEARFALARRAAQRGDTAGARREVAELLADSAVARALHEKRDGFELRRFMLSIGEWRQLEAWALAPTAPAERVRRLIGLARYLHGASEAQRGRWMVISNGPDYCRDVF
jgi:hypothetical protein